MVISFPLLLPKVQRVVFLLKVISIIFYNNALIYSLLHALDFNIFTESSGISLDHFCGTKD